MDVSLSARARQLVGTAANHRKHFKRTAAAVLVYATLGFLLLPWLVKDAAIRSVGENLNAELRLGNVAINPFVLSLTIDDLELDDSAARKLVVVDQIFVNFQLSSLFRWAFTFDEFFIVAPEIYIKRDSDGVLNLSRLAKKPTEAEPADDEQSTTPRLLVFDFAIRNSVVHWSDQVPVDPVETIFGPINIEIADLNTLPARDGRQDVVITTESQGTLSWSGSLQLNPVNSSGRASITGSHFPLTSAYLRHATGIDIVDGTASAVLDYRMTTEPDGSISAAIDGFNLTFEDVLVRTFHGESVYRGQERDLLALPKVELLGGALRWPEKILAIESVSIDDAQVSLHRRTGGELDIGSAIAQPAEPDTSTEPWKVSLQQLAINRLSLDLIDDSVQPRADIGLQSLDLVVSEISNEPGALFPTKLSIVPRSGGNILLDGTVSVLPEPLLDVELTIDALQLAGLHPYIKPLADVQFDSGALNLSSRLQSSPDEPLSIAGDLSVVDFLITETDEGSRLGSWARFDARKFELSTANESLNIAEVRLLKPYGDILIAQDGSVNLGRVQRGDPTEQESPASSGELPLAINIGRVVITDAAADFADLSLPLPFAVRIANLSGGMSTIATTSSEPSTVTLEGAVDKHGFVQISGTVTPFDTTRNTDLKVAFQNVEMPKFSSYTVPFAGREIASGRLDLDLGYKVTSSELVGENRIVLRELELGDKVPHPEAMSLPLGLAVALLKDSEGKIDIDLPVRGNVDDPEFRYGRVVWKALGALIVKIAASPFALLGNLLGVEASELEQINFLPGRADLTPPEAERAIKLAEALALRPELVLELRGIVDTERDGLALKSAQLNRIVEGRIAADASVAEKTVLEQLYTETGLAQDARAALQVLRDRFTTTGTEALNDDVAESFDELAYISELRRQLVDAQSLPDDELSALASQRAENTRAAILSSNADLTAQINIGEPQSVTAGSSDAVPMKVALRTASNDD